MILSFFLKAGDLLSRRTFLNFCTAKWNLCHSKPFSDKDYFLNSTKYQMVLFSLLVFIEIIYHIYVNLYRNDYYKNYQKFICCIENLK